MSDNTIFYGTKESPAITYLEFGEIDLVKGKKKVWEFQLHQKAYDWLMLSRYANDLQAFISMGEKLPQDALSEVIDIYNREVHHSDEASLHLAKIIALDVTRKEAGVQSFYELGQTIFGCIEGAEFYQELLRHLNIYSPETDLKDVDWYGVDISEMFNKLSKTFHREYRIHTMLEPSGLPDRMDVFFSKGISLLYAVRNIAQLFETIRKGRCAVFDYSFNLGKEEDTTIGSGKTIRYLNFDDFMAEIGRHNERLYVKKKNSSYIPDTNRIWLDCLYSEESICRRFIELDTRIRKDLSRKLSPVKGSERFLHGDHDPEWLRIEDFMKTVQIK
jgi:hypothetical protein